MSSFFIRRLSCDQAVAKLIRRWSNSTRHISVSAVRSREAVAVQSVHAHSRGQSYWHEPGPEPLLYLTVGQVLEISAKRFGDREAIVSVHEDVRLSYKDLLHQADRLAAGYQELGLRPGDKLAILAPNGWQWVVCRMAAARAGLVAVDVNPLFTAEEVRYALELSGAAAVVSPEVFRSQRYHDMLCQVVPELTTSTPGALQSQALPELRAVITLSENHLPGAVRFCDLMTSATADGVREIQRLQANISPDADHSVQFSSGTTGKPKAIVIAHTMAVNNGYTVGKRLGLQGKKHKICMQNPLFHVFGTVVVLAPTYLHGATLVLPFSSYNPKQAVETAIKERCTIFTGTPTMHVDALRAVEELGEAPTTLEAAISGGAPIPPELVRKILSTLGVRRICNVYGLSETTAVVFHNQEGDGVEQMANTVGKCGEHVEAKVVDENGNVVPFGTPGELLLRGYFTMKRYMRNPEATKEIFQDGWLRTGDLFVLTSEGYGRVVGRIKDMIIRGGENVYPAEVEALLQTHPDVVEAQVVGVNDERLGEELCACLILKPGVSVSVHQLRDFCKGKAANFKIPRYSVVVDSFPKTASGKIQKFVLRQACEDMLKKGLVEDSRAKTAA